MTLHKVPAMLLHQIEGELDTAEMETLFFLCQDLVHDLPSSNRSEVLVTLQKRDVLTPVILSELLYRIKRFDLLKNILGSGKTAVEAHLARYPHKLSKYRVLMTEIDEDLDKEDLSSLVFLLMGTLGSSSINIAKKQSFLTVVTELEKLQLDHLGLLETCFLEMHRRDLAKKIQKYRQEAPGQLTVAVPKHANTLQTSFPRLSLNDPPGVMNKERIINGACPVLEQGQVHISVPETGESRVQVSSMYRMRSQPLGICLIIDCIGNDAGMLANTFKALRFEVRCHFFLSVDSLERELHEVANLKQHKDYDCFVCILISRGNHEGIFCTDHALPAFSLEGVKEFFTGHRCHYLAGKPKLFFIQNYLEPMNWPETSSLIEADGDMCTIPQVADILWSQCTLGASVLGKAPNSSSYYFSALTELLTDPQKRKLPLLDILLELNNKIYDWNRTNPTEQYSLLLKHTLRKNLFLYGS